MMVTTPNSKSLQNSTQKKEDSDFDFDSDLAGRQHSRVINLRDCGSDGEEIWGVV